jgi:serine/threonine-protein kinase
MDAPGVASRPGRLPELPKYEILEEIGHGGMATVYRAKDKRLDREVAVKVIHPHLRDSPEVAHRFSVEARAVAKLRHPNIVDVYDVSAEDEPDQYLVVELLRGITLRKLVRKHGALPPEVAAAVAIELLLALAHAHEEGVVHRDVKPENVILEHRGPSSLPRSGDQPGDRVAVKLTDFGIAKLLDAQGVTSTGQVLGSPAHMAPEQIEGGDVDARADVFGLGVLLYECMVGHLPFEGNNPAQVLRRVLEGIYPRAEEERATVGKPWSDLLDRALSHDPAQRFASAEEMKVALEQELKRLGITSSKRELEAWFDDGEGYEKSHAQKLVARLGELAQEARKNKDVIAAAADYNRALAYAPNDPALLKIVASMHRAEARARLMRQALQVGTLVVVLAVSAFVVTRILRPQKIAADAAPQQPSASVASHDSAPLPLPSAPSSATAAPTTSDSAPLHAIPVHPIPSAPVHPTTRTVTISISPPQAMMAVDGAGPTQVPSGTSIELDPGEHTLTFTCVHRETCDTAAVKVPAGDQDVPVSASLKFKDAGIVVVSGDPAARFLLEKTNQTLVPGVTVKVSMTSESTPACVDPMAPAGGAKKCVQLKAGQTVSVEFE